MPKLFPYTVVDLTHTLDENTPLWDSSCCFKQTITVDYCECTTPVKFRMQKIEMPAGIGTHIDAPAHCIAGGKSIDQLALEDLIVPCTVINISDGAHELTSLTPDHIKDFENTHGMIKAGSFVMVKTGWERFWSTPEKYRNNYIFPSVSPQAAEVLLNRDIVAIGIDTLSVDRPVDGFNTHQLILAAGKYIIENAAHVDLLPATGSFIMVFPLKIKDATEAPVRLMGLINS